MKYTTILTSKGTTTIPSAIRKELGIKPGMRISFTKNPASGEYIIERVPGIEEIRAFNHLALKRAGTQDKKYRSGAGLSQFIIQDQQDHR